MILCFHHNDWDGRCSAAVVERAFKGKKVKFAEMTYDMSPDSFLGQDEIFENIVVVDFSFEQKSDWDKLFKHVEKDDDIIWLDHHKTSIARDSKIIGQRVSGVQHAQMCGAMLAWNYFFPDEDAPEVIEIIDKWDRWVHNDDPQIVHFINGLEIEDTSPISNLWKILFKGMKTIIKERISDIRKNGVVVTKFFEKKDKENVKKLAYKDRWENKNWLILNQPRHTSKVFDSINKEDYDGFIIWMFDGNCYTVSLYSDKFDVTKICEKYGGGGHPGAGGFQIDRTEELPF